MPGFERTDGVFLLEGEVDLIQAVDEPLLDGRVEVLLTVMRQLLDCNDPVVNRLHSMEPGVTYAKVGTALLLGADPDFMRPQWSSN